MSGLLSEAVVTLKSDYGVDLTQKSLYIAVASILFNPTFWNIVARLGCYFLAATIFSLGIFRDLLYERALKDQPTCTGHLSQNWVKVLAVLVFATGNVLVISSMWALGVTGTYLGDYFGILMDDRVTGFPFNVTDNPMYYGSTLSFLGTALWFAKPTGILVSVIVYFMYKVALKFEEPFTAEIYAKRERERAKKSK